MNTIRRLIACTATSALLTAGAVALATTPAQAENSVGSHNTVTDHSGQRDEPNDLGGFLAPVLAPVLDLLNGLLGEGLSGDTGGER